MFKTDTSHYFLINLLHL